MNKIDIEKIMKEWLWRLDNPAKPDLTNKKHVYELNQALDALGYSENIRSRMLSSVKKSLKKTNKI